MSSFAPIRGKCFYWREEIDDSQRFNTRVNEEDWEVRCRCFVEGTSWLHRVADVPSDCPERYRCRYYIYFA